MRRLVHSASAPCLRRVRLDPKAQPTHHACEQLDHLLQSTPVSLSHIEEVFDKVMDKDENGGVSYVEFCEAMKGFDVKWAKTEAKMKAKKLS